MIFLVYYNFQKKMCVRNLHWTPSPRVVFYIDEQIDDIVQDCCSSDSTSILYIDTTFNIRNFYRPATFHTTKSNGD